MSYFGVSPQDYSPAPTMLAGDGQTTAFTLPYSVGADHYVTVTISGVKQQGTYHVNGTTLTFVEPPPKAMSWEPAQNIMVAFVPNSDQTVTWSNPPIANATLSSPGVYGASYSPPLSTGILTNGALLLCNFVTHNTSTSTSLDVVGTGSGTFAYSVVDQNDNAIPVGALRGSVLIQFATSPNRWKVLLGLGSGVFSQNGAPVTNADTATGVTFSPFTPTVANSGLNDGVILSVSYATGVTNSSTTPTINGIPVYSYRGVTIPAGVLKNTVVLRYDTTASCFRLIGGSGSGNVLETNTYHAGQRGNVSPVQFTSGTPVVLDFNTSNNFAINGVNAVMTLPNPTGLSPGQSGIISINQTGAASIIYGSYWKFASAARPGLTGSNGAVDNLAYYVESSTRIFASLVKGVA